MKAIFTIVVGRKSAGSWCIFGEAAISLPSVPGSAPGSATESGPLYFTVLVHQVASRFYENACQEASGRQAAFIACVSEEAGCPALGSRMRETNVTMLAIIQGPRPSADSTKAA